MSPSSQDNPAQEAVQGSCAAVIIAPENHPITESQIDRDALFVLRKLDKAGFSGYLVGGGVRDLYLGKTPKDFDISTDARPGQLRKLFPHSNTIGRRFRLVQVFFKGGKTIEVSTLRSMSEHDLDGPETVLAPNNTFGTLHEDARRRDLTINSLFYEINNHTIIDYVNGSRDLEQAIIRIVGDPEKRISRDPVRMMRAIRHGARNNFSIEEKTWNAICAGSEKLALCPSSRLRDEFLKDLYSGASAPWFSLALKSKIYFSLFPLYKKFLTTNSPDNPTAKMLEDIYRTIDRINNLCVEQGVHRQKDFFLIALTLIPWVQAKYQLLSTFRKGATLFNLGKQIREELDRSIGTDLNLRRSLRQELVNLLLNLAQFIHNRQKGGWPKWLKRKSYFKKSLLFYLIYQEATTGIEVKPEQLGVSPASVDLPKDNHPEPAADSQKIKPAFARNTKGGVFGFRK
ncbi:polya polymerase [Desulforhopalus singaporensis]|uniref:Poly(A) polymerase n=1 Tax=Desulforhopalus singaporensis TaxID=91360 RepID=A0A1H0V3I5_9BACT|nr:polya polymerase [Desulforhopalus singaporensis]SDP72875.1 poly(A) polymerase [Desulforhopalus singaporensis]